MLAFLCALPIFAAQAEQPVLEQSVPEGSIIEVGQEVVGEVEAGWVVEYFLQAKAGDYVMGVVVGQSRRLLVEVEDPSFGDAPFFGADSYQGVIPFCFRAPSDGTYPIRIHSESAKTSSFLLFVGFRASVEGTAIERAKKFLSLQPPSLPGSAMAIVQNGELQMLEARGVVGEGSADSLTLETAFNCPDLLLPFLQSAFLRLRIENKSRQASGLHEHLSWFPAYDPPITLKQVVHSTTDLPNLQTLYELKKWDPQAIVTPEEARKLLCKKQLRGESWRSLPYGNPTSTFLLLELIQTRTDPDRVVALDEALFQPFGMEQTTLIKVDGALPSVRTTPTDFARWMAALQSLELEETSGMMYLHQMNVLPELYESENWSILLKPDDSWAALQMNAKETIMRKFRMTSLQSVLEEPWPWVTPGVGFGGAGGRLADPVPYKVEESSPHLGRFRSEALDLEVEIQRGDNTLLIAGPDGIGMPVERRRGGSWVVSGDFYLSIKFDPVKEGKVNRLVIRRSGARAEFLRM